MMAQARTSSSLEFSGTNTMTSTTVHTPTKSRTKLLADDSSATSTGDFSSIGCPHRKRKTHRQSCAVTLVELTAAIHVTTMGNTRSRSTDVGLAFFQQTQRRTHGEGHSTNTRALTGRRGRNTHTHTHIHVRYSLPIRKNSCLLSTKRAM